jgi:hypothetical protein
VHILTEFPALIISITIDGHLWPLMPPSFLMARVSEPDQDFEGLGFLNP